jgi:predicted ATPase
MTSVSSARAAGHIVLTGGPGAGKSVISQQLAAAFPDRFVRVPEAATQVYNTLQTRWDRLDLEARRDAQRRIYRLQIEQEAHLARQYPHHTLLLDRGTIDGAAYWPDGPEAYWNDLQTTHQTELARYDAVIWMQTTAALGLYDGDTSNTCRFEDAPAAIRSGEFLLHLWQEHPHLHHVGAFVHLQDKFTTVHQLLETLPATFIPPP